MLSPQICTFYTRSLSGRLLSNSLRKLRQSETNIHRIPHLQLPTYQHLLSYTSSCILPQMNYSCSFIKPILPFIENIPLLSSSYRHLSKTILFYFLALILLDLSIGDHIICYLQGVLLRTERNIIITYMKT